MRLQYVTHRSCGGMIIAIQNVFASVDFHKFTTAKQLELERVYYHQFQTASFPIFVVDSTNRVQRRF